MSNYYKLFIKEGVIILVEYENQFIDYLTFIDENREKGNKQIIINSRLMLAIAEEYISRQFIINKIDVSENSLLDIHDIILTNIVKLEDLKKIKDELFNFQDDYFLEINNISFSDENYDTDIIIKANGIIEFKGEDIKTNMELLKKIIEGLLG